MDTSKEYVEMCSKAKEIQENHKFILGDYAYIFIEYEKLDNKIFLFDGDDEFKNNKNSCYYCKNDLYYDITFLPRQDQLQEMLEYKVDIELLYIRFYNFCCWFSNSREYAKQSNSMEQLWLAFVMKEKYNKKWNGNDWEE